MKADLANENYILSHLSELTDEDLNKAVATAKKIRAERFRAALPDAQVESLRRKYKRLQEGQTISFRVNPLITFTIEVKAEYEYGQITDFKVECSEDSPANRAFKTLFEEAIQGWHEDWCRLHILDDRIAPAMDEESEAHKSFIRDRRAIEEQFGVDGYKLLEE